MEAEVRMIMVQGQPRQNVLKISTLINKKLGTV
jgi:hypothetical protein